MIAQHRGRLAGGRRQYTAAAFCALIWGQTDSALRRRLTWAVLLILLTASLNALSPVLFKNIVDALDANLGTPVVRLEILLGIYAAVFALARLCGESRWYVYGGIEQSIQRRLMLLVFDHVHSLSLRFHLGRRMGGLQQIVSNGLLGFRSIIVNVLIVVLPLVFSIALVVSVLAAFYPPVFLTVMLLMCGLYVASLIWGVERQRKLQRAGNDAYVDAFAQAADSYLNFETIKLFSGEPAIRERLDEALRRAETGFRRFYLLRTFTGLGQALWLTLGLATMVTLAGINVARGTMTLGDFVLVNAYVLQLWAPLEFLGFAYREIRMGLTYVEKMLELLDERADIVESPDAVPLPHGAGHLRFENVTFAYDEGRPLLKEVSIDVPGGQTIAIVGPSGAGKSTLARLAFRFYDVTSGKISIDDHAITKVTLDSLRATIAVIPQDTVLFNDTLARNIGIARPGCSQSEIEDASRHAEIHDFIASLPNGYDSMVGERGLKLSGGERQRIAIARAVLKRPRVFVFDEATSALDSETELAIQRNLRTVSRGITTLMIAHRLSTVLHADEIIVLVDGRVVERGRHEDLLEHSGVYAAMWRRQQNAGGNDGASSAKESSQV